MFSLGYTQVQNPLQYTGRMNNTHPVILISGSSGMVGRNLIEHPESNKYNILTPTSKELDLLDYSAVRCYFQNMKPDIIIHAAGRVGGIQANMAHPVDFLVQNWDMGRNLLIAARESGVKNLLNLGSSCMYPRDAENPLKETMVLKGELESTNEGYALAKVSVARLAQYLCQEDGTLQYKTLIPCNLYGRWDKFDPSHSHLVPAIIVKVHQAMEKSDEFVEIWGDGLARREFMYAGEVADAIWYCVQNLNKLPQNTNIGIGQDYSIMDYYTAVAAVCGYKGSFKYDLSRPVGMKQKLVDTKILNDLGWRSKQSLIQGIEKTVEFYRKEIFK